MGLVAAGDITVHVDQAGGTVQFIIDVTGYFQSRAGQVARRAVVYD